MGAAQYPPMKHAVHLQVCRIHRRPVDRRRGVFALHRGADAAGPLLVGPVAACPPLAQFRRVGDGLEDFQVACAAAKIARQALDDIVARRFGIVPQQGLGAHDHARDAEPALGGAGFQKCFLQRMQRSAVAGQPFDGHNLLAFGPMGIELAAHDGLIAEKDEAAAALAVVARLLGPGQVEVVAQHVEQGFVRWRLDAPPFAVDDQVDG